MLSIKKTNLSKIERVTSVVTVSTNFWDSPRKLKLQHVSMLVFDFYIVKISKKCAYENSNSLFTIYKNFKDSSGDQNILNCDMN